MLLNKILITSFVFTSFALNIFWYSTATFTLRDASNKISQIIPKGMYFTTEGSFKLAGNTSTFPIWHILNDGVKKGNNIWFLEKMNEEKILVSDIKYGYFDKINRRLGIIDENPAWLSSSYFDSSRVAHLFDTDLAPFPFTNQYRSGSSLYALHPEVISTENHSKKIY